MTTEPSSSMLISAPLSATILRMFFPPGPISAPIMSVGIFRVVRRGAYGDSSVRGVEIASAILPRMCMRPSRACSRALRMMSSEIPRILMSIWHAVIPSFVPATLKSMSPR